jgi:hypothetical protein
VSSDLVAKWTAIITNIAVVIGLAFVGLELQNSMLSAQSERIDSLTQGSSDIHRLTIQDAGLSKILLLSNDDPESLTKSDLDRVQHWMVLNYLNFRRIYRAHQSGLLPNEVYEVEKAGVGFAFSSETGRNVIDSFHSSNVLTNEVWEIIRESAEQARAYCLDPKNICLDRYEKQQK